MAQGLEEVAEHLRSQLGRHEAPSFVAFWEAFCEVVAVPCAPPATAATVSDESLLFAAEPSSLELPARCIISRQRDLADDANEYTGMDRLYCELLYRHHSEVISARTVVETEFFPPEGSDDALRTFRDTVEAESVFAALIAAPAPDRISVKYSPV